jgi:8-oxo-dGTP diphosphatase
MAEPVEIAIAVVEFEDQFLIGQRPDGAPLAGCWEFPGGKVEPGEDPRVTAARECLEEVGISVIIGDEYPEVVHQYDHGTLRIHFFRAEPVDAELPGGCRFQWISRSQLGNYQFPDANEALLNLLNPAEASAAVRDIRFWLGPAHAILILIFTGLLLNYSRRSGTMTGMVIATVGIALLAMSPLRHTLHRDRKLSIQQLFFDATAIAVTCVFAKAIGWPAFLAWIPLVLLRRL